MELELALREMDGLRRKVERSCQWLVGGEEQARGIFMTWGRPCLGGHPSNPSRGIMGRDTFVHVNDSRYLLSTSRW